MSVKKMKLCVDCAYHTQSGSQHYCQSPNLGTNIATGEGIMRRCFDVRYPHFIISTDRSCHEAGYWFKPAKEAKLNEEKE